MAITHRDGTARHLFRRRTAPNRSHEHLELTSSMLSERPGGPISRMVGVYHMVLRRTLEHFFPDAILDVAGDRSIIDWDGSADETYYRLHDDSDGLGVEIEWLGTRLMFQPGNPSPLLSTERRMVEVIVEAIDLRFRGLFNQEISHRF